VHLNCTQGPALSNLGRQMLAGDDGMMNFSAAGIIKACLLHPGLIRAVEAEFDAQIQWVLDHGIKPTHLDSHRHSHAFLPIFRRVVGLARRYHVRFIRRCREHLPGAGWPDSAPKQRRVRRMLNCMSALDSLFAGRHCLAGGLWGIEHTGQIDSAWLMLAAGAAPAGLTEIMTHPGLDGDMDASTTRLRQCREMELSALCDGRVRQEFDAQRIALVNYGQLQQTT
jgi:predicted glycoside hydrolase/deacetylase ChbG (UPF0249 family)